jgi:hypothetical protein
VIVPKVRHVPGDDEAGAWLGPVTVAPDVMACLSEEKILDLLHEHYAKRPALMLYQTYRSLVTVATPAGLVNVQLWTNVSGPEAPATIVALAEASPEEERRGRT